QVEVHDVAHTEPLDYAVQLPTTKILEHLKKCAHSNVITIRAVLSWNTQPSTIDPDDLNTWGNRRDVLVQLRPGTATTGITHHIWDIAWFDPDNISPATGLASPG